jgi:hypothetical protein
VKEYLRFCERLSRSDFYHSEAVHADLTILDLDLSKNSKFSSQADLKIVDSVNENSCKLGVS